MSVHDQNKAIVLPLRNTLRRGDQAEAQFLFYKIFTLNLVSMFLIA